MSAALPATPIAIPLLPVEQQNPSALASSVTTLDQHARHQSTGTCQHHVGMAAADDRTCSAPSCDGAASQMGSHACLGTGSFGPQTLQQTIADNILEAAYWAGSSDNLAAVAVDLAPDAVQQQRAAQLGLHSQHTPEPSCCSPQGIDHCMTADQTTTRQCFLQLEGAGSPEGLGIKAEVEAQQPIDTHSQLRPSQALQPGQGSEELASSTALVLGAVVGHAGNGPNRQQYRLVQCMAYLPRYAAHLHTDVAGLPILSSSSIWLSRTPHSGDWPVVSVLSGPFQHHTDLQSSTDTAQEGSSKDTQVMLSPATMLQLAHNTALTAHTAPMQALGVLNNASIAWPEPAFPSLDMMAESLEPSRELGAVDAAMQARSLMAVTVANGQSKQEWQQYRRAQTFARGGFGEVWRAERVTAGGALHQPIGCTQSFACGVPQIVA